MSRSTIATLAVTSLAVGLLAILTAQSMQRRSKDPVWEPRDTVVDEDPPSKPTTGASAEWLTEFTLTRESGQPFASAELDGKVHLVNFFFTTCPHSCWNQSLAVKRLAEEFADQDDVRFLSISCDPATDTAPVLQTYAKRLEADPRNWVFLTHDDAIYLRRVGSEMYSMHVDVKTHAERFLLVDKWGNHRGTFRWKDAAEMARLRIKLKDLLAETEPPEQDATAAAGRPSDASGE